MKDFSHVFAMLALSTALGVAVAQAGADTGALAVQEAQLRIALAPTPAIVVREPGDLRLRYPVRQAFAADQAALLPAGRAMLDLVAASLRQFDHTRIDVAVYTDAIGRVEFNRQQSQLRASAVVAYLHSRGVGSVRLIARGVGKEAPLDAENTPEGRDLNRRLELVITPLSS